MTPSPDDAPDDRPEYLRKLFPKATNGHAHGANGHGKHVPQLPASEAERYVAKALAEEIDALATTGQGGRNRQLNKSAYNLAQLVAGGYLHRDDAWNALYTTALAVGLTETETTKTLASGFGAGEASPRVVPAREYAEVPEATTYAPDNDEADGPDMGSLFPIIDWHALWADDSEEEWIVEPLLPARRLIALFSPPKVGKSLLLLEIAAAIARGGSVLGTTTDRPRVVLYVDFENDPRGDLRPRLQAMGLGPGDLGNLKYLSMPSLPYLDTASGGLQLLALARFYRAEVVIIDTISRAVQGEENVNDTWLAFYRNTGLALKAAGIACVRLDHTGKDTAKGMRGGSAKYGDVDAVWSLSLTGDNTFLLECTANRLPITEKTLHLRRLLTPRLYHRVETGGIMRAHEVRQEQCEGHLLRLGFNPDAGDGVPRALELMRAERLYPSTTKPGAFTKTEIDRAVGHLKNGPPQPTLYGEDAHE